jgi:hypothetical protein
VTISVNWEGAFLDEESLAALARFRIDNPGVPVTHFISSAYYTKQSAVAADVGAVLRKHVRPGDEVGVHLHAWNSLVQASRVPVRTGRSFLTADGQLMKFDDDDGFDLDLSIYTVSELRSILATSRRLLAASRLEVAPIFRAGGWLGTKGVLEAARAEGFTVDSSAIDPAWMGDGPGEEELRPLAQRLREVWPDVDRTTQPFVIETPAGPLLEIPDSGGMADQVTGEEMEDHVAWAASQTRRPIFVHFGFDLETARDHAGQLSSALAAVRRRKVAMQFVTVSKAAELAGKGTGGSKVR